MVICTTNFKKAESRDAIHSMFNKLDLQHTFYSYHSKFVIIKYSTSNTASSHSKIPSKHCTYFRNSVLKCSSAVDYRGN